MDNQASTSSMSSSSQRHLKQDDEQRQIPTFVNIGQAGSAYGDLVAEIDSSAPIVSDRIFGDEVPQQQQKMKRSTSKNSRRSSNSRNRKPSTLGRYEESNQESDNSEDEMDSNERKIEDDLNDEHLEWAKHLPWYKRPSEKMLRPLVLLLAIGSGMIMGPRIELGTQLVCEEILGIETIQNVLPAPHERPPLSTMCRESDAVEAGYASLALRITLAMGIVSAITTGFWGGLSDRKGRTIALRITTLGLVFGDLSYIILGLFPISSVPFGKNLLVVGSLFEGLCGGIPTITAAHMAYIADVTPSGTRATVFSFFTGLFFCGVAIGPALGGYVAKRFHSTMTPFYVAFTVHCIYFIVATFFLPESNSPEKMAKAQAEYEESIHQSNMRREEALCEDNDSNVVLSKIKYTLKRFLSSISTPFLPLKLLLPHRRHDQIPENEEEETGENAESLAMASHISVSKNKKNKLDWNLTLVALAYFLEASTLGVLTPKINFAMKKFDWDVEEIGYFLSFASLTRVACLTLIIPTVVRLVHNPVKTSVLPQDGKSVLLVEEEDDDLQETESLLDQDGRLRVELENAPLLQKRKKQKPVGYGSITTSSVEESAQEENNETHVDRIERLWIMRARHLRQIHDSRFDKRLVIGSLSIAAICYAFLTIFSEYGPIPFVMFSGFVSLGGAASAALSSLALALLESDRDAGKFFAAWSILSAISQTIVGPILFTTVFVKTVSFAPQTIFVLGFLLFVCSALTVTFIRVRSPKSLPALPPRPHTPASLKALRKKNSKIDLSNTTLGPFSSSSSRIRLRQPNPFQQSQEQEQQSEL